MKIVQKFKTEWNSYSITLFKKVIKFSYIQLLNSKISIFLFVLMLISQPLILVILFSFDLNLIDYSLFLILIPLIASFIFLLFTSIKLFNENRYNYVDSLMIVKPQKRSKILFARFIVIESLILASFIFQTIFSLIFLLIIQLNNLFIAILVSNLFISPSLIFLIAIILAILSVNIKPTWYSASAITLLLFISAPSLITRPLMPSNDLQITYNNPDISFSKVVINENNDHNTYICPDILNNNFAYESPNNFLGNTFIGNYFIPSEWLISFYSQLFSDINMSELQIENHHFSLINYKFKESNIGNISTNLNDVFVFRPNDISPFDLPTNEYEKLIIDNIDQTIIEKNVVDLKNSLVVDQLLSKLQNNLLWNIGTFSKEEINTLRNLTGVNVQFNQLFYLIRYYNTLINKLPNISGLIVERFGSSLFNLMNYIWTSSNAQHNLFSNKDVLSTEQTIANFYGDDKIYDNSKPILISDVNFIKSDLIRFVGSNPRYLLNTGSYATGSNLLAVLQSYDASITNQNTWNDFVDKISIQLSETQKFVNYLSDNLSQLYDFQISKNWTNIYKYSSFLQVQQSPYLVISSILIVLISLMLPLLFWVVIKRFNNGQYNDI